MARQELASYTSLEAAREEAVVHPRDPDTARLVPGIGDARSCAIASAIRFAI